MMRRPADYIATGASLGQNSRHGHENVLVVEKGGEVRIRLIDLVPEARKTPGFDVAADQSGLPAAGRARDPDDGCLAGLVQKAVQPVPWEISRRYGAGDFRDGGSGSVGRVIQFPSCRRCPARAVRATSGSTNSPSP
jgi:hypothetical protein